MVEDTGNAQIDRADMRDRAPANSARDQRRQSVVAALLLACIGIVLFWELAASRGRQEAEAFALTAATFEGYTPVVPGWSVRSLPVNSDALEPNVLALRMTRNEDGAPVLVRLVHGYNMCDCMRIKSYEVELFADTRTRQSGGEASPRPTSLEAVTVPPSMQVWRVTSSIGDASIWVTSMLKAYDFSATDVDVRSMAFPRVGTPDDPNWNPQGFRWSSLRHPIRNLKTFLRGHWNKSRCDWRTFLGLRKPAWASRKMLTFVSHWDGAPLSSDQEPSALATVLEVHRAVEQELVDWRRATMPRE